MQYDPARHAEIANLQRIAANRTATEPTTEQIKAYLEQESRTVQQQAEEERKEAIASEWAATRPEFKPSAHSGAMLEEFLDARGLPFTQANLNAAFDHLSQRRLIETNHGSTDAAVQKKIRDAEIQRRAQRADNSRVNHTPEELDAMSVEELRARALGVPYNPNDLW